MAGNQDGSYQQSGTLTVLVQQAKGIKGDERYGYGRADPYAVLWLGSRRNQERQKEQCTKAHNNGGSNPVWNQKFVFEIAEHAGYEMNTLYVSLYDQDLSSADDPLGDLAIDVPHHLANYDDSCKWYVIYYEHHPRGMLEVSLSFKASGTPIPVGTRLPSIEPELQRTSGGPASVGGRLLFSVASSAFLL